MKTVGNVSLKNNGGFVTRLEFEYYQEATNKWIHMKGTGDITLGFSQSVNPGNCGVPEGALFRVYAFVVWGTDNMATEMFIYDNSNRSTASYAISGTTLNNFLEYRGVSEGGVLRDGVTPVGTADVEQANILLDYSTLSQEEQKQVQDNLQTSPLSQSGNWGPLGWNIGLNINTGDIFKSSVDARISAFSVNIIDAHLNAEDPKTTVDLSIAGVGIVAELGVNFDKRNVYLKGHLNFVFYAQAFDMVLLSF